MDPDNFRADLRPSPRPGTLRAAMAVRPAPDVTTHHAVQTSGPSVLLMSDAPGRTSRVEAIFRGEGAWELAVQEARRLDGEVFEEHDACRGTGRSPWVPEITCGPCGGTGRVKAPGPVRA